jgi:hypothetical protein
MHKCRVLFGKSSVEFALPSSMQATGAVSQPAQPIPDVPQNPAALVNLGITPGGVPMQVHRAAVEADLACHELGPACQVLIVPHVMLTLPMVRSTGHSELAAILMKAPSGPAPILGDDVGACSAPHFQLSGPAFDPDVPSLDVWLRHALFHRQQALWE